MKVSVFYRTDPARRSRIITRLVFALVVLVIIGVGLAAAIGRGRAGREGSDGAGDVGAAGAGVAVGATGAMGASEVLGASAAEVAPVAPPTAEEVAAAPEETAEAAVSAAGGSLQVVIGPANGVAERSFFDDARLERAASRAKHEETLTGVLSDASLGIEARSRAQDALMDAADTARLEELAESMLKTWGAEDAIVILGEAGASVAVKSGKLDKTAASAVGDIVHRATGINLARITIVERER